MVGSTDHIPLPGLEVTPYGDHVSADELIARVRDICAADERLDAALMYGSFAAGEADAHSDIEFWLFFEPKHHSTVDPLRWCEQIAPVSHLVRNEFGTDVVFFPGLLRGEFHFATVDDVPSVGTWPARGAAVDRMIVLDRRDALRPVLESVPHRAQVPADGSEIETVCGRFANWVVLAHHVERRGEWLRALDALGHAQRHLLWLARLAGDATEHWLTPSRAAEAELTPAALAGLRSATAGADPDDLRAAIGAAWLLGRGYWIELAKRHGRRVPDVLFGEIDNALLRT